MRIDLRDSQRRRCGRIVVDPAQRPTRVTLPDDGREVFLDWETALDDAGQLRRCVACGSTALFHEKAFPQITGIVVVLAFAGAAVGVLSFAGVTVGRLEFATHPAVLGAMALVLMLDVAILLLARRRLVCYQCRTSYHHLSIARYHKPWDRATADRFPAIGAAPTPTASPTSGTSAPGAGESEGSVA